MTEIYELFVLRALSGVAEIERLLELAQTRPNPKWCDEHDQAQALANAVSKRHLGISEADTRPVKNPYQSREYNEQNQEAVEPTSSAGRQPKASPPMWSWGLQSGAGT